jgi:hypothetical protein
MPPAAKAGCRHSKYTKETQKMSYQIRPLYLEILQVLKKADIPYDPLLPAHIKTVTAVNRLHIADRAFIGMAILPGRLNVLIRPKTFLVETLRLLDHNFASTWSIVVMDTAGDLRLVEGITANDSDPTNTEHFVDQVADLVEEQNAYNHTTPTTTHVTRALLSEAATRIAHLHKTNWARWIIYILEVLQDHAEPAAYNNTLTELSLAIEIRQLEGNW